MANAKRNLVGAVAMAAVLFHGSRAMGQAGEPRTIVLHVDNYAQVSSDMLVDAEKKAASIYAAAGIRTMWIDGDSDASSRDMSALHLRVLLLSREMSENKIKADAIGANVMGQATQATKRAYIFCARISETAIRKRGLEKDLLGKVLAHEVGHILLTSGHSDRGIMQANLETRPSVQQHFTDQQGASMRIELVAAATAN